MAGHAGISSLSNREGLVRSEEKGPILLKRLHPQFTYDVGAMLSSTTVPAACGRGAKTEKIGRGKLARTCARPIFLESSNCLLIEREESLSGTGVMVDVFERPSRFL